jgi:hypothetical protein
MSSSVSTRQCYNNTITSFLVWTLCSYGFSAGHGRLMVLCPDDITPCLMAILATQRRLHRGAICTSSEHLLAPPRQNNIARMHRFGLALWRVRRRHNSGCCIHGNSKEDDESQCNALIMHHALNSLIDINKNYRIGWGLRTS